MRTILYGGSFDPVHEAHLSAAEHALRLLQADRVLLMPNASPPHKAQGTVASAAHRVAMLRLAIEDRPGLELCTHEVDRGGVSYTFDTVEQLLAGGLSGDALVLLIGQDSVPDLPDWYRGPELAARVPIAVIPRPEAPEPDWHRLEAALGEAAVASMRRLWLPIPPLDISSTDLRLRVREGRSIRCRCPDPVVDYIEANELYTTLDSGSTAEAGENR